MKKTITLSLFILLCVQSFYSQTKISGKVSDQKKQPLPGANVFIKDSYDGMSSTADGTFSFIANDTGEVTIVTSFIGFETVEKKFKLNG